MTSQRKSIKINLLEKIENFHVNFYNMENVLNNHSNVFHDYNYINNNHIKQKEKLFSRGKWTEWGLNEEQRETEVLDVLLKNKNLAFEVMLPEVRILFQCFYFFH